MSGGAGRRMRRTGALCTFPTYRRLLAPSCPPFLLPRLCTTLPPKNEPPATQEKKAASKEIDPEKLEELREKLQIPKADSGPMSFEELRAKLILNQPQINFEETRDLAQKALGQKKLSMARGVEDLKMLYNQKLEDVRIIFGGQTDQAR